MGDVLTLIEKAEDVYSAEQSEDIQRKVMEADFNLEDFLEQMQQIRKMGPLQGLLGMIPGVGKQVKDADIDDNELNRVEGIIHSMTPEERRNPSILNGKRKRRIAAGCGRNPQEINELLRSFEQMRKMMKQMGGPGGMKAMQQQMGGMDPSQLMGGGGMPQLPPGMGPGGPGGAGPAGVGAGLPGGGAPGGARPKNKRVPKRKKRKRR